MLNLITILIMLTGVAFCMAPTIITDDTDEFSRRERGMLVLGVVLFLAGAIWNVMING